MTKRIAYHTPLIGSAAILGLLFLMTTLHWSHALLLIAVFVFFNAFIVLGAHQRFFLGGLIRTLAFISFAFMTIAYFIANYFTGDGITFDVLTHLNRHSFSAAFYTFENYQKAGLLLVALFIAIYFLAEQHQATDPANKYKFIYSACLVLMLVLHPFAVTSANLLYKLTTAESPRFVLQTIDESYYSDDRINQVRQEIGKLPNVLMIYLESLERTYFDSRYYENLMTELEDLSKQALDFTDVRMTWGATHTIAGMIASLCGVPINSPTGGLEQSGNSDVYMPKAQCLGDITKKLGYHNIFYQGAYLSFTNKGGFMRSHGFAEVKGRKELHDSSLDKTHYGPWGLHDDVLLNKVEDRLDELMESGSNDPFFFNMLTLDTHDAFGKNRFSEWCTENDFDEYADADHKIQHAVYCSDKLLGAFIKRIKDKWGDDLLIVMVNDHAAYPFNVGKRLKKAEKSNHRRLLFSFFDKDKKPHTITRSFTSLDLGATILGYITNNRLNTIGLGSNALDETKPNLLEQQGESQLNSLLQTSNIEIGKKLWQMPSFNDSEIVIDLPSKKLKVEDNIYSLPVALLLDRNGKIIDFYGEKASKNIAMLKVSPRMIWVDQCTNMNGLIKNKYKDDEICLLAGNLGSKEYFSSTINESTTLRYQDYAKFFDKKTDDNLLNDRLYKQLLSRNPETIIEYLPADSIGEFAMIDVHSTMSVKARLFHYSTSPTMAQRLTLQGLKRNKFGYPTGNGFYLFAIEDGIINLIYHWETCSNKSYMSADDVLAKHKDSSAFILVSARQVKCESDDIAQYFDGSPFQSAASVKSIQPYAGYWERDAKKAYELKGRRKGNIKLRLINRELVEKKIH